MKSANKIMSACALLMAVVICNGAEEEQGQKIIFSIRNNTTKPIYGNIYKTTISGEVISVTLAEYYTVNAKECIKITRYKPATKEKRATEYHRIIFSNNEYALRLRIMENEKRANVESTLIPQKNFLINLVSPDAKDDECYNVTSTKTGLNIKRQSSCTPCSDSNDEKLYRLRKNKVSDIELPKQDPMTQSGSEKPEGKSGGLLEASKKFKGSAEEVAKQIKEKEEKKKWYQL